MAVVSLTTDLGTRDYYLGAFKGMLLAKVKHPIVLVDVNNHIKTHDIIMAAYNIRHAFERFPKGTIHVLHINMAYNQNPRLLVVKYYEHYFVAPDNGVLSLAIDLNEAELWIADLPDMDARLPLDEQCAHVVDYILSERPLIEIGPVCAEPTTKILLQPTIVGNVIKGMVTNIDVFDNVKLNVSKELFEQVGQGRPCSIYFRRHDPIRGIVDSYASVPVGEPLARFNETEMLELAVNMGRMATLYGMRLEDIVQIKFDTDD